MGGSFARVNGTRIYHEVLGEGPNLVLIHSGHLDLRMWQDQSAVLAERRTVIEYDARGHGRSAPVEDPYYDFEDLHGLLAHLGVTGTALLGVSMGGRIALDFALTYPNMVEALILSGSALGGYRSQTDDETMRRSEAVYSVLTEGGDKQLAVEMMLDIPMWHQSRPDARKRLRTMFMESPFTPWLMSEMIRPLEPPAIKRLSKIRVPTLIIVGDRDSATIIEIACVLENAIPGAKKAVVPGAGHLPNLEQPELFNTLILEFLARV